MKKIADILEGLAPKIWWWVLGTLILFVFVTQNNLLSQRWSTLATVLGTFLGVVGMALTIEVFRLGNEFSRGLEKLTREVHQVLMVSVKVQHVQELRRKYMASADDQMARSFWHFLWRFETLDSLGLSLDDGGYVRVEVLGSNNRPLEHRLDKIEQPIYTVKIYELRKTNSLKKGSAYCTCINGKLFISNEANQIELIGTSLGFEIAGLGRSEVGTVGPRPPCFYRLSDLQDIGCAEKERSIT